MGDERLKRERRCVEAGVVVGTTLGLGIGFAIWGNPYIAMALILGSWVLLTVAEVALTSGGAARAASERTKDA